MSQDAVQKAIDRFISQLSRTDLSWLNDQYLNAKNEPPPDWVTWKILMEGEEHFAGFVPLDRALQMAKLIPRMQKQGGYWLWDANEMSLDWRSDKLQEWLWHAHQRGEVSDWRHELQDWFHDPVMHSTAPLQGHFEAGLRIERSGFSYLGLQSRAVHVNGFTPEGQLVVGLRSAHKHVDPGLYDNLMAGGISAGESWMQTFAREMQEEAGLKASIWPQVNCSGAIHTSRREGSSWHNETLLVCQVVLPEDAQPNNQDGEVERFSTFDASEVLSRMRANEFTRDGVLTLAHAVLQFDMKLS